MKLGNKRTLFCFSSSAYHTLEDAIIARDRLKKEFENDEDYKDEEWIIYKEEQECKLNYYNQLAFFETSIERIEEESKKKPLKEYKIKIKKPTYKELATHLSVSVSAIQQYREDKRKLMILGLWKLKEIRNG